MMNFKFVKIEKVLITKTFRIYDYITLPNLSTLCIGNQKKFLLVSAMHYFWKTLFRLGREKIIVTKAHLNSIMLIFIILKIKAENYFI